MLTLFIIGLMIFVMKIISTAFKAAWGITKALLFVVFLPVTLVVMFIAGLVRLAMPLLLLALVISFISPLFKKL